MNGLTDALVTGYLMEPPVIEPVQSRPRLEGELKVVFVLPEEVNEQGRPIGGQLREAIVRVEGRHAQRVAEAELEQGSAIQFHIRDMRVEAWLWKRRPYHKLVIKTDLDQDITFPVRSMRSAVRLNGFGKAVVTGHLEKDAEVKPAKNGRMAWTALRVAVPISPHVDLEGEHVDGGHRFVTVKVFGRQAERVAEIAPRRLDHVRVEPFDIRPRSWTGLDPETERMRAYGTVELIPGRGERAVVFTPSPLTTCG